MRKTEREQIEQALRLIHNPGQEENDAYEKGIQILCNLIEWRYPAEELTNIERIDVRQLHNQPSGEFEVENEQAKWPLC